MSTCNCQKQIEAIFQSGQVSDHNGQTYDLSDNIDRNEGEFLSKMIRNHGCRKTLEIGCAKGMSSLYICSALEGEENASHTIIDYTQTTQWHSLGIAQLDKANVDYYRLIEEPSEYALPRMAQNGEKYDFCLIDGWHTFDHTLIDFFYVDRLLDTGGIVVFDDVHWPGIKKLMRYIVNYPNYKVIGNVPIPLRSGCRKTLYNVLVASFKPVVKLFPKIFPTNNIYSYFSDNLIRPDRELGLEASMLALQKTDSDSRRWDWFVDF